MDSSALRAAPKILWRETRMIRAFSVLCLLRLILLSSPALACQPMLSLSTCREVGSSGLVFVGTVELIEPMFLNRWNPTSPASSMWDRPPGRSARGAGLSRSRAPASSTVISNPSPKRPSAAALARLKQAYAKTFSEMSADERNRVQAAKAIFDVASLFYSSVARGMRAAAAGTS